MSVCYNNIRFSLSDKKGELCFTSFDIVGMPACRSVVERLREYLLGRPLDRVDPQRVGSLTCTGCEECVPDVIAMIEEDRRLFGHVGRGAASGPLRPASEPQASESGADRPAGGSEVR